MSLRVQVGGTEKLDLADELLEEFHQQAKDAVSAAADILLAKSHELIGRYGPNAPAPPGETPATVTGNLKKLTKKRTPRGRIRGNMAESGVQYAPHSWLVEYGHTMANGERVAPRPFVRPAVAATEGAIDTLLRERLS